MKKWFKKHKQVLVLIVCVFLAILLGLGSVVGMFFM